MFKKIKLKNSTTLLIGIIIIAIGIGIGFYEYYIERKNHAFSEMNILLYESEIPQIINNEDPILPIQEEIVDKKEEEKKPNNNSSDGVYNYIGVLEIPKINLKGGFLDLNSMYNSVDYNITIIRGSTFPTQENNNLILAAHSGLCPVCYFDKLYKLDLGDEAYISYNGIKYAYKIVNIYEVQKTGKVAIHRNPNKSTLTLITCTRNSDTKQTVYILELI